MKKTLLIALALLLSASVVSAQTTAPTAVIGIVDPSPLLPVPVRLTNGTNFIGDPCATGTKIAVPISQVTSTQLITGTASNRTYVCSFHPSQPSDSTQTYSLVSGTGTVCATSTGAMIGGTTAANGVQIPYAFGNGGAWIAKSDTDADNVCLLQSSTDRIAGVLTYVVAPD